jgi:hypothetical protein
VLFLVEIQFSSSKRAAELLEGVNEEEVRSHIRALKNQHRHLSIEMSRDSPRGWQSLWPCVFPDQVKMLFGKETHAKIIADIKLQDPCPKRQKMLVVFKANELFKALPPGKKQKMRRELAQLGSELERLQDEASPKKP